MGSRAVRLRDFADSAEGRPRDQSHHSAAGDKDGAYAHREDAADARQTIAASANDADSTRRKAAAREETKEGPEPGKQTGVGQQHLQAGAPSGLGGGQSSVQSRREGGTEITCTLA
jgi:hypothetical protein